MVQYVIRRLLQSVLVIVGVATVVFIIMRLTGDPVRLMLSQEATAEDIASLRHAYGLDRPLYEQYIKFLAGAARGNFGDSMRYKEQPAMNIVLERYPATLRLAGAALLISVVLALAFGITSAIKKYSITDNVVMLLAVIGQSMPNFWLGLMFILFFAVSLGVLPSQGYGGGTLRYLLLPALTLAMPSLARTTRLVRSGMLDVLGEDYIRTARAKGIAERGVVVSHALKNAAIPLVTVVGLDFGHFLGGAVITETIFSWPGVGQLAIQSIYNRDFPVVQASVFLVATSFVLVNLLVDVLYTWLDPRVRLR